MESNNLCTYYTCHKQVHFNKKYFYNGLANMSLFRRGMRKGKQPAPGYERG